MKAINTDHAPAKGSVATMLALAVWLKSNPFETPVGGWTKRSFDVSVALTMLIVFSPLIAGLALLVYSSSPGPVLYPHRRVGYRNRPFRCLKLRSMVVNGDEVLKRHLQRSPDACREWEETRKLKDDPRVTPVGHVLRKLSLDELPQLYNVLRGDMSLVGPRPVPNDEMQR